MAEMIARKIFPDIGVYRSACVNPAESLDSNMVSFMENRSFDMSTVSPEIIDKRREYLSGFHVIVGLNKPVHETVEGIPFRTSSLDWDEMVIPDNRDTDEWETLYKSLALQIRELMTLLRGKENI